MSGGCCGLVETIPYATSAPHRWYGTFPTGATAAQEVPCYAVVDPSSGAPVVPTSSQRFWVFWLSVAVEKTGLCQLFMGTSTADETTLQNQIWEGWLTEPGGAIMTLPPVQWVKGDRLWVKHTAAEQGQVSVTANGIMETVP